MRAVFEDQWGRLSGRDEVSLFEEVRSARAVVHGRGTVQ
jgi:hypothetical protein